MGQGQNKNRHITRYKTWFDHWSDNRKPYVDPYEQKDIAKATQPYPAPWGLKHSLNDADD